MAVLLAFVVLYEQAKLGLPETEHLLPRLVRPELRNSIAVRLVVPDPALLDLLEEFVEVQGTAEGEPFDRSQFDRMLDLAAKGITELVADQRVARA